MVAHNHYRTGWPIFYRVSVCDDIWRGHIDRLFPGNMASTETRSSDIVNALINVHFVSPVYTLLQRLCQTPLNHQCLLTKDVVTQKENDIPLKD